MTRIYLAAPYRRQAEMARCAEQLRALGHVVTSRWHEGGGTPLLGAATEEQRQLANRYATGDIEDTIACELFVAFTTTPMASELPAASVTAQGQENGGTHVEFGIGLGFGKVHWVVGPRENVFHCLDTVVVFPNWEAALEELTL